MAFSYNAYTESDAVKKARQALEAQQAAKPQGWSGGSWGDAVQKALEKLQNRQAFAYDLNGDALYNQYKDSALAQGRAAMEDTVGKASALTGGYGNSYAVTAGSGAYRQSLQQLNDAVPQLYALAYQKYLDEGDALQQSYDNASDRYNAEYGEYLDAVKSWNTDTDRLSEALAELSEQDYDRYAEDYDRAFAAYRQQISEEEYAQDLALQIAKQQADREQAAQELALAREKQAASTAKAAASSKTTTGSKSSTAASTAQKAMSELEKGKKGSYPMDNNTGFEASAAGFAGDKTALNSFLDNAVKNGQISEAYKSQLLEKYG